MDPIIIGILMMLVLIRATASGMDSAWRYTRDRYKASASRWRKQHPASPHAAKAAGIAAAVVYGTVPATKAMWHGFREEWIAGRDRVRERYPDRYPPPAEPESAEHEGSKPSAPDVPAAPPPPAPRADSPWQSEPPPPPPPTEPPRLTVIDGGRAPEQPRTGEPAVTTEVTTIAGVRKEVEAYAERARAEREDAAAELARAQADVTRLTSLGEQAGGVLDRDPAAAAAVQRLRESAEQRATAAQTRVAAADAGAAQAAQAMQLLNSHRPMEEAKGATPQASTNTDRYAPV